MAHCGELLARFLKKALFAIVLTALVQSCQTIDDNRIPYAPVRIPFTTQASWETLGVTAALEYRNFILSQRVPSNYNYTSLTYTGFGGVLLCADIHGLPVAYDLSCPVERSRDVRIIVDMEHINAYCPKCHSVYDIFSNNGVPLEGEAARLGYGLKRYKVVDGSQGVYRTIVN